MSKKELLRNVIQQLRDELHLVSRAADDARSGATDSEVKSESKYDTRGLEASYLARGHAMKFEALADDVVQLERYECPNFAADSPAGLGALVTVEQAGEKSCYFILPKAGGTELEPEEGGMEITVVTPDAPVGKKLCGLRVGDQFSISPGVPEMAICEIA